MNKISNKWLKVILWVCSYVNIIVFALVGGFIWLKNDNEEIKKEFKKVLWVTIIFIAINALLSLISACIGLGTYNADASRAIQVISSLVTIGKIITYVVFIILALVNKEENSKSNNSKEEINE